MACCGSILNVLTSSSYATVPSKYVHACIGLRMAVSQLQTHLPKKHPLKQNKPITVGATIHFPFIFQFPRTDMVHTIHDNPFKHPVSRTFADTLRKQGYIA